MYPSGSRDRTRNAADRVTGAWVRIPPSPPQKNTCEVALAGVFVFFGDSMILGYLDFNRPVNATRSKVFRGFQKQLSSQGVLRLQ